MKQMLIDANQNDEVRVAIVDQNDLVDYESENFKNDRVKGNIYLAKIIRVEPSLQAAFVDYGAKKHGFLAYNEIHPDYFKIPTADKKKLLEQEFNESQNLRISEELGGKTVRLVTAWNTKSSEVDEFLKTISN